MTKLGPQPVLQWLNQRLFKPMRDCSSENNCSLQKPSFEAVPKSTCPNPNFKTISFSTLKHGDNGVHHTKKTGTEVDRKHHLLVHGYVRLPTTHLPQGETALLQLRLWVIPVLVQDKILHKHTHIHMHTSTHKHTHTHVSWNNGL